MDHATEGPILLGFEQIGRFFGRNRDTAARWVRDHQLPVARLPDGRHACAVNWAIDWMASRRAPQEER